VLGWTGDGPLAELRPWAAERWPEVHWADAVVTSGAFHTVVVPSAGPVLRVSSTFDFTRRTEREAGILRTFAASMLPVPIPRLLDGPIVTAIWAGVLITRIAGHGRADTDELEPIRGDGYRHLLDAMTALDPQRLAALPEPRAWCGGGDWPELVRTELVPLLPGPAHRAAVIRVDDVLRAESGVERRVCHGDFGPHNLLWDDAGQPAGLIDLDHACVGDPAIDIAPLISFHGASAVAALVPAPLLERAMIHRATLSLQVAAAAHLCGLTSLRDHALRNFATRHDRGTLFDPQGVLQPD
jgi:hypothetical protein